MQSVEDTKEADDVADDSDAEAAQDGSDLDEEVSLGAGELLRAEREERGLSLDHVSAETRIPLRHLETIEAGDFDALPARTYAIGFARTYARALEMDDAHITGLVRTELNEAGPRDSVVGRGMAPGDPAKLPSRTLAWFGALAALVLLLGVVSFAGMYFQAGQGPASLLDTVEAENAAAALAEASQDVAEATPANKALSPDGKVVFTATGEGAWVRFYEEDGERLFEGVMEAGDTFELPATAKDPRINTGRPNLFQITINGVAVEPLSEEMVPIQAAISARALLERETS
ncbi:MAG: helix-turn-helix domain-containing protein [Pseudomonadota bacterium]